MSQSALALLLAAPLLASPAPPLAVDQPAYEQPERPWTSIDDATRPQDCRDRIRKVREERGLPELDSETPDPVVIYAVDRREDGCSVVVVKGDPEDIRPLPKSQDGPLFRRIPAR